MDRNIPIVTSGYKLTIVEPPAPKTKDDGRGGQTVVVNRDGVTQFVVSVFAKLRPAAGQRAPKGAEIKVTLETDPGDGFGEDSQVELINPRVSAYQMGAGKDMRAGLSFKATGLKPAGMPAPLPRPDK